VHRLRSKAALPRDMLRPSVRRIRRSFDAEDTDFRG
jgi:hypothetical protein